MVAPYSHYAPRTKLAAPKDYLPFGSRSNIDLGAGRRALVGAGVGGLLGAGAGAIGGGLKSLFLEDPQDATILKNVLIGAGIGGLGGAGAGALFGTTNKAFDMEWRARENLAHLYNNILLNSAKQTDRAIDAAVKTVGDSKVKFDLLKGEAKLELPQGKALKSTEESIQPYLMEVDIPGQAARLFYGELPPVEADRAFKKYIANIEILPEELTPELRAIQGNRS